MSILTAVLFVLAIALLFAFLGVVVLRIYYHAKKAKANNQDHTAN